MRWTLALRGVLTVVPLAVAGLQLLDEPVWTGMACLTALLMVIADFRGTRQHRAYLITAAGCLVAAALGAAPTPTWTTVVLVTLLSGAFAGLRGFSGFLAAAGVTVTAELLIAVGLRTAGAHWTQIVSGAAVGAAAALIVGRLVPGGPRELDLKASEVASKCAAVLAGRSPGSGLTSASRDLMSTYIESTDRPQAPTREASAQLTALNSLAACADLLSVGTTLSDPHLRAHAVDLLQSCAENRGEGIDLQRVQSAPTPLDTAEGELLAAISTLGEAVSDEDNGRGSWAEWREQMWIRMQPDGILLTQALIAGVLYGGLTVLVLTLAPPHPQWVLLGAVTATYPYARRSAIVLRNLLLGTAGGFAVLLLVLPLADLHPALWWVILVAAVVLAVGAPRGQRGWIIGQSAFTTLSLTLLALSLGRLPLSVIGERLENVVVGAVAAVVVAAVLAPRTMRARYQAALAELFDTAAAGMGEPSPGGRVIRAGFLKCADIIEVIRGTGYVGLDDLVDWLDGARQAVVLDAQASAARPRPGAIAVIEEAASVLLSRAAVLRANRAIPAAADLTGDVGSSLNRSLDVQRHDLRRLSPRLPRSDFA